jgi:hypothetical protein
MIPAKRPITDGTTKQVDDVAKKLHELILYLRSEAPLIEAPKAQAIFETTAEVLWGLETALVHYRAGEEPAMREETKLTEATPTA